MIARAEPSKTADAVKEVPKVLEDEDGLIVLEATAGATVWWASDPENKNASVLDAASELSNGGLDVSGEATSGAFELVAEISCSDNG